MFQLIFSRCAAQYDLTLGSLVLLVTPVFFIAFLLERKRQKDFREGRIKGVPRSKGIIDYLFFNYEDDK